MLHKPLFFGGIFFFLLSEWYVSKTQTVPGMYS